MLTIMAELMLKDAVGGAVESFKLEEHVALDVSIII